MENNETEEDKNEIKEQANNFKSGLKLFKYAIEPIDIRGYQVNEIF